MESKKVAFAGFLDGYKAQNVAKAAESINYQLDEMKNGIALVLASQRAKEAPDEILDKLKRINQLLSNYKDKGDEFFPSARTIGVALQTVLRIASGSNDSSSLLSEEKIKLSVYHYLELAELSEDKEVTELAISIAEMF